MLCKRVFINGEEEETIQSLKHIGMEIVKKCDGLPLAIKAIAGVLSGKERTRGEWEKVDRSIAWSISGLPEDVTKALYLSYDDLPSHLKQSFLYLSLFPEDYKYGVNKLVPLWIAEGLVKPEGSNSLEDTAEGYYKELIRRSLLHPVAATYHPDDLEDKLGLDGSGECKYRQYFNQPDCQMHDVLRSLACFLSGNECFCGDVKRINKDFTSQDRRLFIEDSEDGEVLTPKTIIRSKHLRTLLHFGLSTTIENDLIFSLGGLRVLCLNEFRINHVPDSIGNLIHLRYLSLDGTDVSKLPESLGRLTNLQFLSLCDCRRFHRLPNSIGDLIHMRFLLLNESGVYELPDSLERLTNLRQLRMDGTPLKHVPKGIGKLQQLNYLNGVFMGSDNDNGNPQQSCNLEDLEYLSQLRFLGIRMSKRASTGMLKLQTKSNLTGFDLKLIGNHSNIEQILNELVPPTSLEFLKLCCRVDRSYSSLMSTSSLAIPGACHSQLPSLGTLLPRLSDIRLEGFMSCPRVPPLGELPQLKSIRICEARTVVTIGPEFMGAGVKVGIHETAFPKLESLQFERMDNLEEWSLGGETTEERADACEGRIENQPLILFPLLKKLKICYCPNLRVLPISGLPALKSLTILHCPALEDVGNHNVLQELTLAYDEETELPVWLIKLLEEQRLQAEDSNFKLKIICEIELFRKCLEDGHYWTIIQQIPQVEVKYNRRGLYMRYTKVPSSYKTNLSQDPDV